MGQGVPDVGEMDMAELQTPYLKGHFLMAMPGMSDPNFHRSVTCISEHTRQGAVGIVVNQVHSTLNGEMIFNELAISCNIDARRVPIHIGGPVHGNELFVLHGPPLDWDGSLVINSELALSNSKYILEAIAQGRGPAAYLISLGCAGWGPGQLEFELGQNVWLTGPFTSDLIFRIPIEERWEAAIKRIGIDPALLSNTAGHA
jgi:putative transcriptional regulator